MASKEYCVNYKTGTLGPKNPAKHKFAGVQVTIFPMLITQDHHTADNAFIAMPCLDSEFCQAQSSMGSRSVRSSQSE